MSSKPAPGFYKELSAIKDHLLYSFTGTFCQVREEGSDSMDVRIKAFQEATITFAYLVRLDLAELKKTWGTNGP